MTSCVGDYHGQYRHETYDNNPMENRPEWGRYRTYYEIETVIYWIAFGLNSRNVTDDYIRELTEWAKENIENVWEGPIGYMGYWKFRFTTEEDVVAFKLRV